MSSTTNLTEILKKVTLENAMNYTKKIDENDKFLEIHKLLKPIQEEIDHLNRSTTSKGIEPVSNGLSIKINLSQLFQKAEEEVLISNSFYKASITLTLKLDKDITRK